MKKTITILMLLSVVSINFSQELERDKTYVFTKGTAITPYNKITSEAKGNKIIAQSGWKFKIDETVTDGYVIRFLKWESSKEEESENNKKNTLYFEKNTAPIYFHISKESFEKNTEIQQAKIPMWSFVSGALTVPIKIRPGGDERDPETMTRIRQFDFANDINIGLSAGVKLRIDNKQRAFLNLVGGVSLTSIAVDEDNTRNFVDQKTNASSITYSVGLVFQYDDFQIGLINGWDYLSRDLGDNWVYQGRPWYGVGLGLSIFSSKDKSNTN